MQDLPDVIDFISGMQRVCEALGLEPSVAYEGGKGQEALRRVNEMKDHLKAYETTTLTAAMQSNEDLIKVVDALQADVRRREQDEANLTAKLAGLEAVNKTQSEWLAQIHDLAPLVGDVREAPIPTILHNLRLALQRTSSSYEQEVVLAQGDKIRSLEAKNHSLTRRLEHVSDIAQRRLEHIKRLEARVKELKDHASNFKGYALSTRCGHVFKTENTAFSTPVCNICELVSLLKQVPVVADNFVGNIFMPASFAKLTWQLLRRHNELYKPTNTPYVPTSTQGAKPTWNPKHFNARCMDQSVSSVVFSMDEAMKELERVASSYSATNASSALSSSDTKVQLTHAAWWALQPEPEALFFVGTKWRTVDVTGAPMIHELIDSNTIKSSYVELV